MKKLCILYETLKFITASTSFRYRSMSWFT